MTITDTKQIEEDMSKVSRAITIEKAHRLAKKNTTWALSQDFRYWLRDYFTTADHRIRKVRWQQKVAALNLKGDWDNLVYEKGNMVVTIEIRQDDDADVSWLGTFSDDEGDIRNPRWTRGNRDTFKFFTAENTTVDELTKHYNGHLGMPKHDARLAAIKSIEEDAKMAAGGDDRGQEGIIVRVEIDGTYVGEDSLWGNYLESKADVWEVVTEHSMIEEALAQLDTNIAHATENLDKLTAIREQLNQNEETK